MTLARWTLSFLRPYRARVVVVAALSLAELGLVALAPWPLKVVVDNVLGDRPLPDAIAGVLPAVVHDSAVLLLAVVVVAGLLLQIANQAIRLLDTQMQVDMGQRIVYDLRAKLLAHLQALPLRHHVVTRTAASVYRLDADAYCVDDLVIGGVFPLVLAVFNLGLMFVILVYLDLTLALLSLVVAPFLYLCLRYHSRTLTVRAENVKGLESTLIERAFEVLSSIAAIKSFARERHELARFSRSGDATMRARLDLTWQESLFLPFRWRGHAGGNGSGPSRGRHARAQRHVDGGEFARCDRVPGGRLRPNVLDCPHERCGAAGRRERAPRP